MIFFNAKIYKKFNCVLENGFVRVENGLIKQVGSFSKNCLNFDDEFVDCEGLKIVPGFIDSHCHVGMWENGLDFEGADGNEETDPVCPQLRAIDGVSPQDDAFVDALKSGVTTVVTGPGSANPIGGSFVALKTFGDCVDEMVISNSVGIKFALGENPKSVYNEKGEFPTTRMAVAALIRENLEKARKYIKRLNISKKDPSLMPEYDIKMESLKPLLENKTQAFFHCHRVDDIFTAIRLAKEFNLKFVLVHATEAHLVASKLKEVKIISGPLICDRLKPELKNHSVRGVVELLKNGLPVSICSDHAVVPVNFLLQTCALLVKFGLKREEVLKLITENAADLCGISDRVGTIENDKIANFVVFKKEDDIFSPYTEPKFVVIDGKIVVKN